MSSKKNECKKHFPNMIEAATKIFGRVAIGYLGFLCVGLSTQSAIANADVELTKEQIQSHLAAMHEAQATVKSARFDLETQTSSPHSEQMLFEKIKLVELVRSQNIFVFSGDKRYIKSDIASRPFASIPSLQPKRTTIDAQGKRTETVGEFFAKCIVQNVFDGKSLIVKRAGFAQEFSLDTIQTMPQNCFSLDFFPLSNWHLDDPSASEKLNSQQAAMTICSMNNDAISNLRCWKEGNTGSLRFEIRRDPISTRIWINPLEGWTLTRKEFFGTGPHEPLFGKVEFSNPQRLTDSFSVSTLIVSKSFISAFADNWQSDASVPDLTIKIASSVSQVNSVDESIFSVDIEPGSTVIDMHNPIVLSEKGTQVKFRIIGADGSIAR